MAKSSVDLSDALTLINHGPTVLISVDDPKLEKPNLFALAWITPIDFEPPALVMAVSKQNYSHELIQKTGEFVVNIPNSQLVEKLDYCGNVSGRNTDKFKAAGLTPLPAQKVKAPLVGECIGHLECRVIETKPWGEGTLFFAEVVAASADEGLFVGHWNLDLPEARSIHHMGGHWYAIATSAVEVAPKSR